MRIPIKLQSKEYILYSDIHQFIIGVEKETTDKGTGEKRLELKGKWFYPNIEFLLEDLYKMGLRDNDVTSFRELRKHSDKIKEIVVDIASKFSFKSSVKGSPRDFV